MRFVARRASRADAFGSMVLREGHGKGVGSPHIETLSAGQQPVGVSWASLGPTFDPIPSPPSPGESSAGGPTSPHDVPKLPAPRRTGHENLIPGAGPKFAKGNVFAKKGGVARGQKAAQLRALVGLGLRGSTPEEIAPYLDDANQFAASEVSRLARECGGGICPPNAAALVQQAALAMAGSRAKYAQGDSIAGAKLGVEVRQNLLGARELTVLEAKSRAKENDPRQQFEQAFGGKP